MALNLTGLPLKRTFCHWCLSNSGARSFGHRMHEAHCEHIVDSLVQQEWVNRKESELLT